MFCIRLFNFVSYVFYCYVYVFLFVCLFFSVYCVFIVPTGIFRLPWLRVFPAFSSVVRQMPRSNWQRRGTVRTFPNYIHQCGFESQKAFQPKLLIVLFYVLFVSIVLFYVLFVCKCVLYYCQRVSAQLQLINISKSIYSLVVKILPRRILRLIHAEK